MKTLHQKTLKLLEGTAVPFSVICYHCEVSPSWLNKVKNGKYGDPGVNKIERIFNYLTDENKKVKKRNARNRIN